MDPQATWQNLLDAYQANEWPLVEEAAQALLGWLARGGFPPRLDNADPRAVQLIVQLVCSKALAAVPECDG